MTTVYENKYGIQFNRYDFKKRSVIKVESKYGMIMEYRFNNRPLYEHKLLSWANLDMCNGWTHDEDYIPYAINNGTKLCGTVNATTNTPDIREAMEQISAMGLEGKNILPYKEPWKMYDGKWNWIFKVYSKGCLADYFDLDEIRAVYATRNDLMIDDRDWADFTDLAYYELAELPFDLINPVTDAELVATGLAFGYPIESTSWLIR